jgi:hypothetical protein
VLALIARAGIGGIRLQGDYLTRCSPSSPHDEPRLPRLTNFWQARRADERYWV